MDFYVNTDLLNQLEQLSDHIVLEVLKEVHTKFLSDLDFSELEAIRNKHKKKKFILKKKEPQGEK